MHWGCVAVIVWNLEFFLLGINIFLPEQQLWQGELTFKNFSGVPIS